MGLLAIECSLRLFWCAARVAIVICVVETCVHNEVAESNCTTYVSIAGGLGEVEELSEELGVGSAVGVVGRGAGEVATGNGGISLTLEVAVPADSGLQDTSALDPSGPTNWQRRTSWPSALAAPPAAAVLFEKPPMLHFWVIGSPSKKVLRKSKSVSRCPVTTHRASSDVRGLRKRNGDQRIMDA